MAKGKFQARVLLAFVLFDTQLQCNDLLESDEETIKDLVKQGNVDDNPKAVAYCVKELKKEPVVVESPKVAAANKMAAAEAAVKAAEEELKAAKTDEEKTAAQEKLDAAKADLEKLKQ